MAKPLIINLPHALGAVEAKRRIAEGIEHLKQQYAAQLSRADVAWDGDRAELQVDALGQTVHARVEVTDDHVVIEIDLPWLLRQLAQPLEGFFTRSGAETLRITKS